MFLIIKYMVKGRRSNAENLPKRKEKLYVPEHGKRCGQTDHQAIIIG